MRKLAALLTLIGVILGVGFVAPTADAGTKAKDNPSGPYVVYTDAHYDQFIRPFGVWFPIDIAVPGHNEYQCHMRAKWGNLFTKAFDQLQMLVGNGCKWGGMHLAYSYKGGLPSGIPLNNDYCVADAAPATIPWCVQISSSGDDNGSIFMQPTGGPSPVVQSEFLVCVGFPGSGAPGQLDDWFCYHEFDTIRLNF